MAIIDLKEQFFGVEIELTGLTRQDAAEEIAVLFQTNADHVGGNYDKWSVTDQQGKTWDVVSDSSIRPEKKVDGNYQSTSDARYKVELVTPKLGYAEMEKLQEVVRTLRHAKGKINSSMGMHVHVDASNHTPQSIKNSLTIMHSKEDIIFKALKVNEDRVRRWCKKVREPMLQKMRKLPTGTSMRQLETVWYEGDNGSNSHYDSTRYHGLNVHSVFYRGTLEWRCLDTSFVFGIYFKNKSSV